MIVKRHLLPQKVKVFWFIYHTFAAEKLYYRLLL